MFHHLEYEAEFPPSLIHPLGRKLSGKLDYLKGLTAITGANESGKSFSLEMLRFGLWGSAALRGSGEDYTSIKMEETWSIRGVLHRVTRTLKKATLYRGAEVLATGVSVVNEKIVKIMGFGIEVFDVACSANQDDLLRITSMKPTERRRLVDSVVGIGALEVVGKWASNEAGLREREAQTMRGLLTQPAPVPDFEGDVANLSERMALAEQATAEIQRLRGWLAQTRTKPSAPVTTISLPSENLKQFADDRKKLRLEIEAIKAQLAVLPVGTTQDFNYDELRAAVTNWEIYDTAQRRLARNPKPTLALADANSIMATHTAYARTMQEIGANEDLSKRISKLKEHKLQCPACSHEWHVNDEQIAQLEAQYTPAGCLPAKPEVSYHEAELACAAWGRFDQSAFDWDSVVPVAPKAGLTLPQIDMMEKSKALEVRRDALKLELEPLEKKFAGGQDFEQMLGQRLAYEASLSRFHEDTKVFVAWLTECQAKQHELERLKPIAEQLPALRLTAQQWMLHQQLVVRFEKDLASYTAGMAQVVKLETEAAQYRLMTEAMARIRTKVKQFLLPSLNRVASVLLARLTGGARTSVIIDEDFEIKVDGQRVSTLSGSGKACANLAIRIALGQVLVSGVMSVFLGDEIDGSMDSFRAEETALTLRTLVNTVSQILIVSHKNPEADHKIILGNVASEVASET